MSTALPLQTTGRCCSDLRLDQLLAGDLDEADARALRTHLESSPRCRERLATLEADRAGFVAAPPMLRLIHGEGASSSMTTTATPTLTTATTATTITTTARPALVRRLLTVVPVLAAAAGLVLALRGPAPDTTPAIDGVDLVGPDIVRAKGGSPVVVVHRRRDGIVVRLGPGDIVKADDALQVSVGVDGPRFVGVVGVDHDGVAAWIPDAGQALPLNGDGSTTVTLPTAVALDGAPAGAGTAVEIVVHACVAPTAMSALVAATAAHTVVPGCATETLRLTRETRATP